MNKLSHLYQSYDSLDSQVNDLNDESQSGHRESQLTDTLKRQKKLYYIANELTTSEEIFVDVLHLLNCEFRAAVEKTLPKDVLDEILQLLSDLQAINENLLSELKERTDNWSLNSRISDVFLKIGPYLKLYAQYIKNYDSIIASFDNALEDHSKFSAAVKEFESSPRCRKLSVKHYMLKPVQRMPQYRLLLQQYLKNLPDDSPDYQEMEDALTVVSNVAEHVDGAIKQDENFRKMLLIQNSVIGHEILKPGRLFIKEGELMKISRKELQLRYFILFTDCLMYLTPVQHGVYRFSHELSLTGMRVSRAPQKDFQNEFSVISHTRSFSLMARSIDEREEWIMALNKAIEDDTTKIHANSVCEYHEIDENKNTPKEIQIKLGHEAPVWITDARVTMCHICTRRFTIFVRRHHCRCCGKVFCNGCSSNRIPLPYLNNSIERVCDECIDTLKSQTDSDLHKNEINDDEDTDIKNRSISPSLFRVTSCRLYRDLKQKFERRQLSLNKRNHKKNIPEKLTEVSANDQMALLNGYLHWSYERRRWKQNWFVIKDMVLYKFAAPEDVAASDAMPLVGYRVETIHVTNDDTDPMLYFRLTHPGRPSILFRAETVDITKQWIKAINESNLIEEM